MKFSELSSARLCQAVVTEPQGHGKEECTKFVSSLALCVNVNASLHNVKDPRHIAVQVSMGRRVKCNVVGREAH